MARSIDRAVPVEEVTSTPAREPGLAFWVSKWLRHGRQVASPAPSTRAMARATARHVDPARPQVIVELGAGTGPVTEYVCEKMHPRSRLIAIEVDEDFVDVLERRCPRAEVVHGDAGKLGDTLDRLGVGHIDVLLNGLPTPSMPKSVNREVLETFRRLQRDAWLSQITIMPLVYKKLWTRNFEDVKYQMVFGNLPPGGVYHCRGLKPHVNFDIGR